MSEVAHVAHATRGRARLRLPSVKGDKLALDRIAGRLREYAPVMKVAVSPQTGSVLIHHRGDIEGVIAHARSQDLFEVREEIGREDVLERLKMLLLRANTSVHRSTDGTADLRTFAFAALLGGSVYQLLRRNFLPAGGAMLFQALEIVLGIRRRDE